MASTDTPTSDPRAAATLQGLLAVLFWGSTIAFSRSLTERLGTFTAATSIFLLSGVVGCALSLRSPARRRALAGLPRAYWLGCGSLFVGYMLCLYLAIGLAVGRQQVVEVGMINYLWPSLTLVLSIALLGKRPRWSFWPGLVLAGGGVGLVMLQSVPFTWESFRSHIQENWVPFALALAAAVSWALYSNLTRRWAGAQEGNPVPLFLLVTGCGLLVVRLLRPEPSDWSGGPLLVELAYMALFPTLLAYVLWDRSMRQGHVVLVAAASYGTPLLSTVISCLYLDVPLAAPLYVGCGVTVLGAVVSSRSLDDGDVPLR